MNERDARGRFRLGNRGGGRKRLPEDLKKAFRGAGYESLDVLLAVMRDGKSRDADRIRAAEIILDRGYGKPSRTADLASEDTGAVGVIILPAGAEHQNS